MRLQAGIGVLRLQGDRSLSQFEIDVETANTVPVPKCLPTVVWRVGRDPNSLSVSNDEDLARLRACIWPEHVERRQRLDLAASIVAAGSPRIDRGALRNATLDLIDEAPRDAIKVVFHSAVLAYVDETSRIDFATTMRRLVDNRSDVIWLSNEGPSAVAGIEAADPNIQPPGQRPVSPRTRRHRTDCDHRRSRSLPEMDAITLTWRTGEPVTRPNKSIGPTNRIAQRMDAEPHRNGTTGERSAAPEHAAVTGDRTALKRRFMHT